MKAKRKGIGSRAVTEATTKLSRILETEDELEAMLEATRRQAKDRVESARLAAKERARTLDEQLAAEDRKLQRQIAQERDAQIKSIRTGARAARQRIEQLDDDELDELARHVVELLIGRPEARGPR